MGGGDLERRAFFENYRFTGGKSTQGRSWCHLLIFFKVTRRGTTFQSIMTSNEQPRDKGKKLEGMVQHYWTKEKPSLTSACVICSKLADSRKKVWTMHIREEAEEARGGGRRKQGVKGSLEFFASFRQMYTIVLLATYSMTIQHKKHQ